MLNKSILDHFSALEDPRQRGKVLYPLTEILLSVLCATLSGADDFVEIELWCKEKQAFLRRFLPYNKGIPSHDTFNDVLNSIPKDEFTKCFISWVDSLREAECDIVSIDGKTSRRAHNRSNGQNALHMVSAWASEQRLVLGQEACGDKSNEITAIPGLLKKLELTGALVTIDAMGCQTKIAEAIRDKGADYLLAVKGNQASLYEELQISFVNADDCYKTTDGDHGRIEQRCSKVCYDVDWLSSWDFKDVSMIGVVESITECRGKISTESRYYICSAKLSAKQFGAAVRTHWGIENRLHWVLDVVFHDDLMRLRTHDGPANMATVRHICMNIVRSARGKKSLKCTRKALGWNEELLYNAITDKC